MPNDKSKNGASLLDYAKAFSQYPLPQHLLSRVMHALTRNTFKPWKKYFTEWFINHYGVDLSQANRTAVEDYRHFNDFFTRSLKPTARPIEPDTTAIACPVDGTISQIGDISIDTIFQAKARFFSVQTLLGNQAPYTNRFNSGHYTTLYLSPRDYHRIHMPLAGKLIAQTYIPGRLFSVNPATVRAVPNLFARNERVVTIFETEAGLMAMVLVGAIFVASIETVWQGVITPPRRKAINHIDFTHYADRTVLQKGEEMGRFNMGSTVVLLFEQNNTRWLESLSSGSIIRMGQRLGTIKNH